MNIADILEQQAQRLSSAPSIYVEEACWSYQTLNQSVWQVAMALHRRGVRPGEVIAHTFASELALLVAALACARIGATVLSVPGNMPARQRDQLLNAVSATWLATDLPDLQFGALKSIHVGVNTSSGSSDEQVVSPAIRDSDPAAPWIIVSGSGTTGKPKLMAVTHRQQWARMEVGLQWLPYARQDVLHSLVRLDFYGAKQRYLEAFMKGASISLGAGGQVTCQNGRLKSKATVIYATVFHVEQLLTSMPSNCKGFDDSFSALMIGGSTVSVGLRQRIRDRISAKFYVLYGANECHTTCRTDLQDVFDTQGNVGRPHPGFTLQIVDANHVPLPPQQIGQVRIRSQATIDGYLDDAPATLRAFRQGWFYPGDLGRLTADGRLIHLGRADDMMIMNGINMYPAEIEQVMTSHPAVLDAAVMPLRHAVHQDIPVCAVTLLAHGQATEQTLMMHARQHLGAHSPHRVVIVGEIPRNEQGKLIRAELAALIMDRLRRSPKPAQAIGTSRQLTKKILISFQLPPKPDLALLDAWLTQILTDDLASWPEPVFTGSELVPELTRQWLWRCLRIARLLLQAARVPIFDAPHVFSCAADVQGSPLWQADVALALVDDQFNDLYREALNTAFELAAWAALRPLSQDNLNLFFETISQRILVRAKQLLPFGKSTFPILQVAHAKAIPFRHLGGGVFQLGWGANARRLDRSATELDSTIGAKLSNSKALTARLLRAAGLPGAVHVAVRTPGLAVTAAQRLGWPLVVKPVDGERGEGVTVDVADEETLKSACDLAMGRSRSKVAIVERQVAGVCHRLFMVNGKVLYAVKRWPMLVIGDGQHTVAELVALEVALQQQKPPWKRSEIKPLDELARAAIAAAGFSETDVAPTGVRVPLRRIESTEWGGVDEEVTQRIHPENLRISQAAAALMGLHVAGVDIITNDIGQPWHENGAIINEVNFAPLLGGADISRRHIPMFLDDLLKGRGLIPVDVFVGGAGAWQAALQRQQSLVSQGLAAYVTHEFQTLAPTGEPIPMSLTGGYPRAQALLLSSRVGAMVLCVQTDEFLNTGLPLEWVNTLVFVDRVVMTFSQPEQSLLPQRFAALAQLLEKWKPTL